MEHYVYKCLRYYELVAERTPFLLQVEGTDSESPSDEEDKEGEGKVEEQDFGIIPAEVVSHAQVAQELIEDLLQARDEAPQSLPSRPSLLQDGALNNKRSPGIFGWPVG